MNIAQYNAQYYVPACIPPYLTQMYLSVHGTSNINFDSYYPPFIPCL